MDRFNPWWLAYLAAAAGSLVVFNNLVPGAGVYIALGVGLWWFMTTDSADAVNGWIRQLRRKAGYV